MSIVKPKPVPAAPLLKDAVRARLATIRKSGGNTKEFAKTYRTLYRHHGPNDADRYAGGFIVPGMGPLDSYPLGAPRLPKGALNDSARRVARAATIRERKGGMR